MELVMFVNIKTLCLFILITALSCSSDNKNNRVSIKSISPPAVNSNTQVEITLTGSGFNSDYEVMVNNTTVDSTFISSDQMTVLFPALEAGFHTIKVINSTNTVLAETEIEVKGTSLEFLAAGTPYLPELGEFNPTQIIAADFRGTGLMELAALSPEKAVYLSQNAENIWTEDSSSLNIFPGGEIKALSLDLTENGKADLFLCRNDGFHSSLFGFQNQKLQKIIEFVWGFGCLTPVFADLNLDEKPDLVFWSKHPFETGKWRLNIMIRNPGGSNPFLLPDGLYQHHPDRDNISVWTSDDAIITQGNTSYEQAYSGNTSLKIDYDFSSGTIDDYSFLNLENRSNFSGTPEKLKFQLHGDGSGINLTVRVWDASEERFALDLGPIDWTGWKSLDASAITSWEHYAGNGDGVFDLPVTKVSVQLNPSTESDLQSYAGVIYLDNVELVSSQGETAYIDNFELTASIISSSEKPLKTMVTDLDSDGIVDIITLFANSNQLGLYNIHGLSDASQVGVVQKVITLPPGDFASLCLLDLENDGDPDIFAVNRSGQDRMLMNDGSGHFTDITQLALPVDNHPGQMCQVHDLDNDGFDDIVISSGESLPRLYRNSGELGFYDYTPGLNTPGDYWTSFAVSDTDQDGDLDFIAYVKNIGFQLYVQIEGEAL
jgi:hypothetical protein